MGDRDADRSRDAAAVRYPPPTPADAPDPRSGSRGARGQTTIDFAIGVGLFLIVVAFVIAFLPGVLQPFTDGSQDGGVTADRVASTLAGGMLGSPAEPYALDTGCTVAFFDDTAPDAGCEFSNAESFEERLGLGVGDTIDVTLAADLDDDGSADTVCWAERPDSEAGALVEASHAGCDVEFTAGAGEPGSQSVVTARRAVSIDGTDVLLRVRSW